MAETPPKDAVETPDLRLNGTTYRLYRFILRQRKPIGVSDAQRGLGLSSPSVAQYHIRKLLSLGLIREEQAGYVVDKVVVENVIRIRRVSIPLQTAYVAFFGVGLLILLVFLRPAQVNSVYFFAVVINTAALAVSIYEAAKTFRRL